MSKNKLKHFQDLDNFVIFGAGEASHPVRSYLEKIGKKILVYSDNNSNLHGSFIKNTLVIEPEAIRKYFSKGTGIIIACSSQEKIAKQLVESLGFSLSLVFPYITEMFAPQFGELAYQEISSHVEQTCGIMNDSESIKYIDSPVNYRRYLNPLQLIPNPKVLGFYNYKTPIPMIKNGDTIIDCGAYTGDTAQEFLSRADIKEIMDMMLFVKDSESRSSFLKNIKSRFSGELGILPRPVDKCIQFKNEFLKVNKEEVFVDAGAYTGDTLKLVLESPAFEFREFIALEPDPKNFTRLQKLVGTLDEKLRSKITTFPVAAGSFNGEICFDGSGTEQARISLSGNIKAECRRLDDLLRDWGVTFIKMDIEGAELDALEGASDIIKNNSPVLAVSVYHQIDHLWRILSLINDIKDDYAFFFRPHAAGGWDYILYAVPQNRLAIPLEA